MRAIEALYRLPGRRLFQFLDAAGRPHALIAAGANAYLTEIAGAPVSAKDFRMLPATAEAATRMAGMVPDAPPTHRRIQVASVVREIAQMLGNTSAVVRNSCIHHVLFAASEGGRQPGLAARAGCAHCRRREGLGG